MNISNAHVEAESLLNKVDQNSVSNFLVILLCFSSPIFLLLFLQYLLFFLQLVSELQGRERLSCVTVSSMCEAKRPAWRARRAAVKLLPPWSASEPACGDQDVSFFQPVWGLPKSTNLRERVDLRFARICAVCQNLFACWCWLPELNLLLCVPLSRTAASILCVGCQN